MDIKQSIKANQKPASIKKPLLAVISFVAICGFALSTNWQANALNKQSLLLANVKQGPISLTVSGYGQLRSKYARVITAPDTAQVEEVLLQPGSRVSKDTVLIRLSNPNLVQALNRARLALARQKAAYEALKLRQQGELLSLQGNLALLQSELESAQLKQQAEQQLAQQGIVSSLDYKRSQLTVAQLTKRVQLANQQLTQAHALHQQGLQVEHDLVSEYEISFQAAQQAVDKLAVTAGIDGMLQQLNVTQGQTTALGTTLAVVGSEHQLLADLQVPEREASSVQIGQDAVINTFSGTVAAKVNRINPIVNNGRVVIELELTGALPSNARPLLTIEGDIIIEQLENALYMRRASFLAANSPHHLFVLSNNQSEVIKTEFEFGKLAGDNIVINSGANAGDTVVISDLSDFKHLTSVKLHNN
jgi:HlyD family secretion protein